VVDQPLALMALPSSGISNALVERVQKLMGSTDEGPITKWTNVIEILKGEQLAYVAPKIAPTDLLVHPDNRAKLGVNPHNAHRTGAYIKKMGADLDLLKKATAFEVCPYEPKKSEQLGFNRKLVAQSNGLLAPVSGTERFLTVGCGHTAAFCKAAMAGCTTPQQTLADKAGCLNVQHLSRNDQSMAAMLSEGWAWTVVSWRCELAWPSLPDLAQRALNAANSVASQSTEMEIAASIAEFAGMQMANCGRIDWDTCAEAAVAGLPPCHSYAKVLSEFVRLYGGGSGAPMIHFLDGFAKEYGESLRLGEDYLRAVTEVQFGPTKKCPHIRTALLAVNLCTSKVVDGVGKLLVKGDVEKLKKCKEIDCLESTMQTAWDILILQAPREIMHRLLGRLQCRCVLWATGKGKLGFEKKAYEGGLEEIKRAFIIETSDALRDPIDHPWFTSTATVPGAATPSVGLASATSAFVMPTDLSDIAWIAKQAGFEVGGTYYEKLSGASAGIYILKHIDATDCKLEEYSATRPSVMTVTVPYVKLVEAWAPFKGSMQQRLPVDPKFTLEESLHMSIDVSKARILIALHKHALREDVALDYFLFPAEVRTTSKVAKGKLALSPATDYKGISTLSRPGSVHVTVGGDNYYLTEPSKPRTLEGFKADTLIVPYWWVLGTADEAKVNMQIKKVDDKESGMTFQLLVNTKVLQPHEALYVFKPKKEIVPLSSASSSASGPPAKKSRA